MIFIELMISAPVHVLGIQIDLFDGNFKSVDDYIQKDVPKNPTIQKGARSCPEFPTIIWKEKG